MSFSIGTLLPVINRLLKFIPDPEQREKLRLSLLAEENSHEVAKMNAALSGIIAEAQSRDKWTSRARPFFLYVVNIYLLAAIPFALLGLLDVEAATEAVGLVKLWFSAIPDSAMSLFGVGYLGYCGARSYDKAKISDERKAIQR